MTLNPLLGIISAALLLTFYSCETDDVEPSYSVTLSSSELSISEANGSTTITATLNQVSEEAVSANLVIQGTATETTDYTISSKSISIPAGSLTGSVQISSLQDTLKEGNETIDISILNAKGAELGDNTSVSITLEDDDVAPVVQILVNEVLYDPPSGSAGDANGDGTREAQGDEFIEFINTSTQPLDMSGFKIFDTDNLMTNTPRHLIPEGTIIPSGKALVVFGGGSPTGSFGGATVQTASEGRLNLNNMGDEMTLTDSSGTVLVTFDINPLSGNPDESYTRNPDITGDFEQHGRISPTAPLFSPGTKIDGSPF